MENEQKSRNEIDAIEEATQVFSDAESRFKVVDFDPNLIQKIEDTADLMKLAGLNKFVQEFLKKPYVIIPVNMSITG